MSKKKTTNKTKGIIKPQDVTVNVHNKTHKHMYNLTLDTLNYILQKLTTQMTPINTNITITFQDFFFLLCVWFLHQYVSQIAVVRPAQILQ